jgi:hypothetical protein
MYGTHTLAFQRIFVRMKIISLIFIRGVNYSKKSVRRFLGLENPGNFSRDSGIFSPSLRDLGIFNFQLIFSKYFPLFFFTELFPTSFATYNPSNYF